jgi:hypothetical protein
MQIGQGGKRVLASLPAPCGVGWLARRPIAERITVAPMDTQQPPHASGFAT